MECVMFKRVATALVTAAFGLTASCGLGAGGQVLPETQKSTWPVSPAEKQGFDSKKLGLIKDFIEARTGTTGLAVAVNGSIDICLGDKNGRRNYHLCSRSKGLLVPPETWNELTNFSPDAVLLVFASHNYDPTTYINSHDEFLEYISR